MSKREMELKVSPENLLKDLKVLGIGLRLNAENELLISGLTTGVESGMLSPGARQIILDAIRAMKPKLIAFLRDSHDKDQA